MFEGIGFWEALQLKMVIPWGLDGLGMFYLIRLGAFTVCFAIFCSWFEFFSSHLD